MSKLLAIAKSRPEPLSEGMKSLANFINSHRVPRIVEISKNAKKFKALLDEGYVSSPLIEHLSQRPFEAVVLNPPSIAEAYYKTHPKPKMTEKSFIGLFEMSDLIITVHKRQEVPTT